MDKAKAVERAKEIEGAAPHYADPRQGVRELAALVRELIEASEAPAPAAPAKKSASK